MLMIKKTYFIIFFFFPDEPLSESNKEFASPIIHSFKQLIYNPGVWDIFVLKLVEVNFIAIVNNFFPPVRVFAA